MSKKKQTTAVLPDMPATDTARQLQDAVQNAFGNRLFQLRRDGLGPLAFEGRQLAEVTSYGSGTRIWYELAAYISGSGYIAAIKVFKKAESEKDIFRADSFATMHDLCRWFETYDPSHDVSVPSDLSDTTLSTAEAMIRAAGLRQRMDEARQEYRAAAGELLTSLAQL
ncbi:MAG: hypothetical protein ACRCWF_18870 [Beijerinckiaceae bacterium]